MSRKTSRKAQPVKARKKPFIWRAGSNLMVALIVLGIIALIGWRSGWFFAQAERNPDTKRAADRLKPLIPDKVLAPGYEAALSSENETVRKAAEDALAEMSEEDRVAITNLLEGLQSGQADVRTDALDALADMGEKAQETAPHVVEALRDANETVRAKAAETLGKIKARADIAIPALKEALGDAAASVRESAQTAIDKIQERREETEEMAEEEPDSEE